MLLAAITEEPSTSCRTSPRRYLIVPDEMQAQAELISATSSSGAVREEAGIGIRQPSINDAEAPAGDLRPALSGEPEVHVEGIVSVNNAGVTETARFGWVRDGDDPDTDLQLRQAPNVFGRRPDLVERTEGNMRYVRPKLLSLRSGDLLMVWYESNWGPLYGRNATLLTITSQQIYLSRLDHTVDRWSAKITGPVIADDIVQPYIVGCDFVQFPDSGEIVLLVLVQNSMTAPTTRRMLVYWSVDDGDTWTEKRCLHFNGVAPDIILDTDGDWSTDFTIDDASPFQAIAVELLPSGRMVAVAVSENAVWSLISDDRGSSFSPVLIQETTVNYKYAGHGVSCTLARNGIALFVISLRALLTSMLTSSTMNLTANGVDWTQTIATDLVETVDTAICISPDGWPQMYGTAHSINNWEAPFGLVRRDWLWGRRLSTRDPQPNDGTETLYPMIPYPLGAGRSVPTFAFHIPEASSPGPSGGYGRETLPAVTPGIVYYGFVGVDAVEHRGQIVLCATVQHDLTPVEPADVQPTLEMAALMVYRANHWQPIQERLGETSSATGNGLPGTLANGFMYNRTWDCYDRPRHWGWTETGLGNDAIVEDVNHGGYLRLWGVTQKSFEDITLPAPSTSRAAVLRAVVWIEDGGSLATDIIAIKLSVNRGGSAATAAVVRFQTDGVTTDIALFRTTGGGVQIGGTLSVTAKRWIEVLLATDDSGTATWGVQCFARIWPGSYPETDDPDWDEPYQLVAETSGLATDGAAIDSVAWGHFTEVDSESWWKTVQLNRSRDTSGDVYLDQLGVDYLDADSRNDKSVLGSEEPEINSGIKNVMRTAPACTAPSQFLTRGVRTAWRGESMTNGQFDHASGYDFGAHLLQLPPALEEWRSNNTSTEIELIWDAGATGVGFRPDAIAVFGRNFPSLTIQFNDTNSWGAPAVSRAFGYYGDGGFSDRYTHIWATDNVDWEYTIYRARVTVFDPDGGAGPWIPHQFRSLATGPKHYVVWNNLGTATEFVYQILDNTEDTLILATSGSANSVGTITGTGYLFPYKFAIFSDRFASLIEHAYPATYNPAGPPGPFPNSHARDYRYCRVVLPAVTHGDLDATFYRCGYIMLGRALEISAPDAMWGWSSETESGYQVDFAPDGVSRTRRRHSPRKTLAMDYGYLRPPAEASAAYNSPSDALYDGKRSWLHWVEAARRLENDGLVCALIWEGDRAVGQLEETTAQVTSSPDDLMLARVTQAGSVEHAGWENRSINLANGVTTLPRPACTIKRIVFREEF